MKSICVADEDTVTLSIPSNVAIDLVPALAVLSLLDATCAIAIRALACSHPEIGTTEHRPEGQDYCEPAFPSAAACTASCLISHLEALRFGIDSYRRSIDRELPGVGSPSDL